MDHESLRTAATYLNNLLLARGLLRNGEPVDFVKPSRESRAQIINLVHDLILRDDRDREARENVAVTLRALRSEDRRKTQEIERLAAQSEEHARRAAQAQAAERAAAAELRAVERVVKGLQDQTARLKAQLQQVRAQCATDVRKRDLELSRLKGHLQGQQRGGTKAGTTAAPAITITGGGGKNAAPPPVDDPEYSLRQETTEFLTQLGQNLSDENDALISLVRDSLHSMRTLLGLPPDAPNNEKHPDSALGGMGSGSGDFDIATDGNTEPGKRQADDIIHALPSSPAALSATMHATLARLKAVLTDPHFVPLEEVEARDEEIRHLRDGWERMEARWRDVLRMMEGWRRRMDTGETINADELRRGMGLVSPARGERDDDNSNGADNDDDDDVSMSEPSLSSIIAVERHPASTRTTTARAKAGTPASHDRVFKRKRDLLDPPPSFDLRPSTGVTQSVAAAEGEEDDGLDLELELEPETEIEEDSNPTPSDPASPNPLTVAQKLRNAQSEADDAVVVRRQQQQPNQQRQPSSKLPLPLSNSVTTTRPRVKPTSTSTSTSTAVPPSLFDGPADALPPSLSLPPLPPPHGDKSAHTDADVASPAKKTRVRGLPRRKTRGGRKSTLSPEELETLLAAAADDDEIVAMA